MERASKQARRILAPGSITQEFKVQSSNYLTSSIRTGLLTIAPLECIQDYDNSDA